MIKMDKSLREIEIEQLKLKDMRMKKVIDKHLRDVIKHKEQSLLYAAYGEFMRKKEPSDYDQTISSLEFIIFLRRHNNNDYNHLLMTNDEKKIYNAS